MSPKWPADMHGRLVGASNAPGAMVQAHFRTPKYLRHSGRSTLSPDACNGRAAQASSTSEATLRKCPKRGAALGARVKVGSVKVQEFGVPERGPQLDRQRSTLFNRLQR